MASPKVPYYRVMHFMSALLFFLSLIIICVMRSQTSYPPIIVKHHNGTLVATCHLHHRDNNSSNHEVHHDKNAHQGTHEHEHEGHHHDHKDNGEHEGHHTHTHHHHGHNEHNHTHHHNETEPPRERRDLDGQSNIKTPDPDTRSEKFDPWLYTAICVMILSIIIKVATVVNLRHKLFGDRFSIPGINSECILTGCNILNVCAVVLVLIGLTLVDFDHWPRHPCSIDTSPEHTRTMNSATYGMSWVFSVQYLFFCLFAPFLKIFIIQVFEFQPI